MTADREYFKDKIFTIASNRDFERLALELFEYQCANNALYGRFINLLGITPDMVKSLDKIPFLPIEFFKDFNVTCRPNDEPEAVFTSSATSGLGISKHLVYDLDLYEQSFIKGFELFYGPISNYCILALLPSYLEREGSSLVYMADKLIKLSKNRDSDFYLNNLDHLVLTLESRNTLEEKTLLLGVTFALLNLAERYKMATEPNCIVMDTGGMKGRRKEITRQELHGQLCEAFECSVIHSEYGMTELFSQAYSQGNGQYQCPPWMRMTLRDINDPFGKIGVGATGGINIIDLANIDTCAFIATSDIGRMHPTGTFEVLGRYDYSDVRGCNLLAV